jgi:protein-disulfide isomerase
MRNKIFIFIFILAIFGLYGCNDSAKPLSVPSAKKVKKVDGCSPEYRALADQAVVELKGKGELNIVVVTDPLCWHCRLAHKLLAESPEKYKSVKLLFFPRRNFIGSDMAAWIMEDAAGTDQLKAIVDFGYGDLKQPKSKDLDEARAIVLVQFTTAFPKMLAGTNLPDLYARLKADHEPHVLKSVELCKAVKLAGTPILIAGKNVLVGYGPDAWLKTLDKNGFCE